MNQSPPISIQPGERFSFTCPATGRDLVHCFDEDQVRAVELALLLQRPLLVRGEPGAGKSQLAKALAVKLEREFLSITLDSLTESRDLLYDLDLVQRLADAQVAQASGSDDHPSEDDKARRDRLELRRYLSPGPLWRALTKADSLSVVASQVLTQVAAEAEAPSEPDQGPVLLIDEIDKADPSVPNGLLGVLGDQGFEVPGIGFVNRDRDRAPLVVITTNEERALPHAFLRRCVVLHLALPEGEALIPWLMDRGQVHHPDMDEGVLKAAAEQVAEDRLRARSQQLYGPGQAEYLDLLKALVELTAELTDPVGRQIELLDEIGKFLLEKDKETL